MKLVAAGILLAVVSACSQAARGQVTAHPADSNVVSILAGWSEAGHTYYLIDTKIQRCWFAAFFNSPAIAPLDCCTLTAVDEARTYLTWLPANACNAPAPPPAQP